MKKRNLFLTVATIICLNSTAQNSLNSITDNSLVESGLFDNSGNIEGNNYGGTYGGSGGYGDAYGGGGELEFGGTVSGNGGFGDAYDGGGGFGYGGGYAELPSNQLYGAFSQPTRQTYHIPSVRQNYPNLVNYIVPSLSLEEGIELSVFLEILEGFESFKLNWILDQNVEHLNSSKMPRLKFNDMHVGDILDALNSFAISSPNYNILFKSYKNTLSIESVNGVESGNRRPLQSYPISDLYKKYSIAEILTLVEAALQFEGKTSFKHSTYKPRYHEESQILMLNLTADESKAINHLFNSLRQNSVSREYTPRYKDEVIRKMYIQKDLAEEKINDLENRNMELAEKAAIIRNEIAQNPEAKNILHLTRISDNIALQEKYLNDQIHKTMSVISKIDDEILIIQAFGKK